MESNSLELAILVIDDDDDDLAILRHHLESMSGIRARLVLSQDPEAGLLELEKGSFDAVLLDYKLGSETGLDVYQRIRRTGQDLPVILLTDQGDEELAVICLHAGMADYLCKSAANPRSLRRSITNAVEKAVLQRELSAKQRDLERVVKDLRAQTEEIQSFYHTLSHELKTPLTAVREFVCIVLDGLQGPVADEQRHSLERARACCDQMVLLMNDIVDATRLETGKLALHMRNASLVAVVDQAIAHCSQRAARARVPVHSEIDPGIEQAYFDPQRILQVLTNLLDNAIKYSEPDSPVVLRVERDASDLERVRISVKDHGRGIPPDRQERIFERLYQAYEDDATIRGGLGIGLYLCRQLLRLHGQEIGVVSVPGRGSTFSFDLRTQRVESEENPSEGESYAEENPGRRGRP